MSNNDYPVCESFLWNSAGDAESGDVVVVAMLRGTFDAGRRECVLPFSVSAAVVLVRAEQWRRYAVGW